MSALGVEPCVQVPCGMVNAWQGAENKRKIRGLGRSCDRSTTYVGLDLFNLSTNKYGHPEEYTCLNFVVPCPIHSLVGTSHCLSASTATHANWSPSQMGRHPWVPSEYPNNMLHLLRAFSPLWSKCTSITRKGIWTTRLTTARMWCYGANCSYILLRMPAAARGS
jgi:hypothetical protein